MSPWPGKRTLTESTPRSAAPSAGIEGPIQRRESSDASYRDDLHYDLTGSSATGLPAALQSGIEQLSGLAMDDVKVHRGSPEPAAIGAAAYARGTDIHLGPGQEQHLPHEAWHVVQQKEGRVAPTVQMAGAAVNDDAGLEREADEMGSRASELGAAPPRDLAAAAAPRAAATAGAGAPIQGKFEFEPHRPAIVELRESYGKVIEDVLIELEQKVLDYNALKSPDVDEEPGRQRLTTILRVVSRCHEALMKERNAQKEESPEYGLLRNACGRVDAIKIAIRDELNVANERLTREALAKGKDGGYLWLQPPDGPNALGKGAEWHDDVPPRELRVGKKGPDLQLGAIPSQTLDLLVIGGGHGELGVIFEWELTPEWWHTNIVGPMVDAGVRARCVVVDVCYGATMASVFGELCTGGGVVVGNLIEGGALLTPETWKRVAEVSGKNGQVQPIDVIGERVKQRGGENPQGNTYGVFDPATGKMYVDKRMFDEGSTSKLPTEKKPVQSLATIGSQDEFAEFEDEDVPSRLRGVEQDELEEQVSSHRPAAPEGTHSPPDQFAFFCSMFFEVKPGDARHALRAYAGDMTKAFAFLVKGKVDLVAVVSNALTKLGIEDVSAIPTIFEHGVDALSTSIPALNAMLS